MHLVDRAVQPSIGDKLRQLAKPPSQSSCPPEMNFDLPVNEINADSKYATETFQRDATIRFQQLTVGKDSHLSDVVMGI